MMKKMLLILLIMCGTLSGAQELTTELKATIPLKAVTFVGVDEFDSMYYIKENILYKKTAEKVFSYSNIELGKLSMVNIQNPFKIVLFYANFNSVIILDNNLNELTPQIDFTKETLFNNVSFVTASSQNNLWLFADDNKLHLYDYQRLREVIQTQPMTFYDSDFQARNIVSTYKNVWILSKNGVLEFNEYGIYIRAYALNNVDQIFAFQQGFIYTIDGSFFYQKQNQSVAIQLDHQKPVKGIYLNSSNVYIYDGSEVSQYLIKR